MMIPYFILFKVIREPEREVDRDPIRPVQTFKEVFSNRPFRLAALIYFGFKAARRNQGIDLKNVHAEIPAE